MYRLYQSYGRCTISAPTSSIGGKLIEATWFDVGPKRALGRGLTHSRGPSRPPTANESKGRGLVGLPEIGRKERQEEVTPGPDRVRRRVTNLPRLN